MFQKALKLFNDGDYKKAIRELNKLNLQNEDKITAINYEMEILLEMKDYQRVIDLVQFSFEGVQSDNQVRNIVNGIQATYGLGKFEAAFDDIQNIQSIVKHENIELSYETKFAINSVLISTFQKRGQLENAIKYAKENVDMAEFLKDHQPRYYLKSLFKIAWLFDFLGNVLEAEDYYLKALFSFRNHKNLEFLLKLHNNLGNLYNARGLFDESFKHFSEIKKLSSNNKDEWYYHNELNLGQYYFSTGDIPSTLDHFGRAKEYFEEQGNWNDLFFVYSDYFEIYADLKDLDKCKQYYQLIQNVVSKLDYNAFVQVHLEYYQGLLYKMSSNYADRTDAVEIFENIANGPVVDHIVTYQSMIQYLDMLIEDLVLSTDPNIYNKITEYIDKIEKFATKEDLGPLIIQVHLFKSKLMIIDGKIEEANTMNKKALKLASEFGYEYLKVIVSSEYDYLRNLISEQSLNKSTEFKDRLRKSRLEHVVALETQSRPKIMKFDDVSSNKK